MTALERLFAAVVGIAGRMATVHPRRLAVVGVVLALVVGSGACSRGDDALSPANERLLVHPVAEPTVPDGHVASAGTIEAVDVGPILGQLDRALPTATVGGQWIVRRPGQPPKLYVESTAGRSGRQTLQAAADRLLPGGIRIIHGRYTRAELRAFIDAVSDEHLGQASEVTSVGQGVRDNDLSPTSRSVIVVGVLPTAITDRLLDDLARSVPRSILQIKPEPRARLL